LRTPSRTLLPCTTLFRSVELIRQLQRRGRVAGDAPGLLDGRGLDALVEHADRLVDERADHARGVEPARVVHHDRHLADGEGEVEDRKSTRLNSSHVSISY